MTPQEQAASTLPPASAVCRCPASLPFAAWVRPFHWVDDEGRHIESRTCPGCGCTLSVVKVTA